MRNWIVCLGGEDWWYHSHAHFDIQVMKRLARRGPMLYVCSIGMRMPSLLRDDLFWARIARKLKSVGNTLRRLHATLYVYSPLPIPLYQYSWGRMLNNAVLAAQLRFVFARLGIRQPLFWINTPTAWPVIRSFERRGLVYQRTDDYAAYTFDNFNADYVRLVDDELVRTGDLVLHVSEDLHADAAARTDRSLLLEQGLDERFLEDPLGMPEPPDVAALRRPIVGYVGNMEPHKFDAALVNATAAALPECSFALVGPYHQNAAVLRERKNVHFLGQKTHEEIPNYVRSFDVCMVPTAKTGWGLKCKPIKLMEYLAMGRPVVSTAIPATTRLAEFLFIAEDAEEWIRAIQRIVNGKGVRRPDARARMRLCSWDRQIDRIWSALRDRGLASD